MNPTTDTVFIYRRTVAKLAGIIVAALALASMTTSVFSPEGSTQFARILGFTAATMLAFGLVLMNSASTMTRYAIEANNHSDPKAGESTPDHDAGAAQFLPRWMRETIV